MAGVNQVNVLGNLGQDPELRHTQGGEAVATMSVATSEQWTDKDGKKHEETEWHRVVVWGKQAENCSKYLTKGSKVFVQGKLKTRSWEDKDGVKRYTTEIVALPYGVHFVSSSQGNGGARPPAPSDSDRGGARSGVTTSSHGDNAGLDDIPF